MNSPKLEFTNWIARLNLFVNSLRNLPAATIYEWYLKPPESPESSHPNNYPQHIIPTELLHFYSEGASAFRLSYRIDFFNAPAAIANHLEENSISSDITLFSHAELSGGVEAIYNFLYNAEEIEGIWGVRIEEQDRQLLNRAIPFLHFPCGDMLVLAESASGSGVPQVYHVATDTGEVKRIADSFVSFLFMWEQLLYSDVFLECSDSDDIARRAATFPRNVIFDFLGSDLY